MTRELHRRPSSGDDAFSHALSELEMVTIAWREVGSGLSDAYDGFVGGVEFGEDGSGVEVSLNVQRRHGYEGSGSEK